MVIDHFTIQPSTPPGMDIIVIALIVVGVVLLAVNILLRNHLKELPMYGIVGYTTGMRNKYTLSVIGIVLIIIGSLLYGGAFVSSSSPLVVTVGDGYISVKPPNNFIGAYFAGNINRTVTSEEIADAFVGQIGSGNFTLHKDGGTNFGDTNIGRYTLGNGARAYIATTNATSLILRLKTGEYLIAGTSNTQALATSFAQNVYPLTSLQLTTTTAQLVMLYQ
ncbi:hypothetical protein [Candidatus Bathycorpusculum sp.]|uniref:hypothetical protein n=1 Tax=Candidatus Bathycorpusculum sp. TaxID=2994959 RepID=UPI00281874FC|nr:hypothetical protein [Candidatus Termitimicrobium sp.]MCL2432870.1 hypothetical protein [Candidatus Termitimicrobium sp.]